MHPRRYAGSRDLVLEVELNADPWQPAAVVHRDPGQDPYLVLQMAAPARSITDAERWFRERYCKTPERDALFTTISGEPVEPLYTAEDLPDAQEIGFPGEYPYTRGVQPTMYRAKPWTMRMFAGFGAAEETNERFKYLLSQGQTGL